MLQWLSKMILRIWGFKVTGNHPRQVPKKIYLVVPHTSNMDFPLGMLVKTSMKIENNFLAKHTLFRWPIKWFVEKLGFLPVDRTKQNGLINQLVEVFNNNSKVAIGMAPEGTRSKVNKLRSGFYHIALQANVPLILVTFDWGNKVVHFSDPYYVSDDKEKDMAFIENYFSGIEGYNSRKSFNTL